MQGRVSLVIAQDRSVKKKISGMKTCLLQTKQGVTGKFVSSRNLSQKMPGVPWTVRLGTTVSLANFAPLVWNAVLTFGSKLRFALPRLKTAVHAYQGIINP